MIFVLLDSLSELVSIFEQTRSDLENLIRITVYYEELFKKIIKVIG